MEAILEECRGLPVAVFQTGDRLVFENEPADAMFVLIDGAVEIVRGGVGLMTVSAPGALIGEMSALLGKPCSATVRAVGEVTAYRVEGAGRFLADRPVLLLQTAQLLARRLDKATASLADLKVRHEGRRGEPFGVIDEVLDALLTQADHGLASRGG